MNDRLNPKTTPKFWRKVRNIAVIVGVVAGAVLSAGATLPPTIITIATIAASASAGVAGAAQMTKE